MHFCGDEARMLLALVPGIGWFIAWLKAKLHHRKWHSDADCTDPPPESKKPT